MMRLNFEVEFIGLRSFGRMERMMRCARDSNICRAVDVWMPNHCRLIRHGGAIAPSGAFILANGAREIGSRHNQGENIERDTVARPRGAGRVHRGAFARRGGLNAQGMHALAFPSFGPEAPRHALCARSRIDQAPIGDRSAVREADYVVYLDETLLGARWEEEVKPGGVVLVNSAKTFDDDRIFSRSTRTAFRRRCSAALFPTRCSSAPSPRSTTRSRSNPRSRPFAISCPPSCMRKTRRIVAASYRLIAEFAAARGLSPQLQKAAYSEPDAADASRETSAEEEVRHGRRR